METSEFVTSKDKIEFRIIVLSHLKKILDVSLKITPFKNEKIKSYTEAIKSLSDVLLPFYDSDMNSAYSKFEKDTKTLIDETTDDGNIKNDSRYFLGIKQIHRELFRNLNLLMKRIDYLKGTIYSEEEEE